MDLIQRPRRLRGSENLRKMVRETRMDKSSLIYPLFVKEGTGIEEEIPSMEGQFRYSIDRLPFELERLQKAGVNSVMLFGIPDHKDEVGSGAYDPNGIVQKALREAKKQFPDMYYITDVCMCEYTSHGHCGVLCGHDVDNDATLELLAKTAVSHIEAGADTQGLQVYRISHMSSHHQPADWLWSVLFRSIISSKKFLTSYNPIAASSSCSLHEMSRQLLLNIQLSWFILGSPLTSSNY